MQSGEPASESLLRHFVHDNARLRIRLLVCQGIATTLAKHASEHVVGELAKGLADRQEIAGLNLMLDDPGNQIPVLAHLEPSVEALADTVTECLVEAKEWLRSLLE